MGETENWDEFRGHNDETGETMTNVVGKIMFDESWDVAISIYTRDADKNGLAVTGSQSFGGGNFDIMVNRNLSTYGPSTGKLLNGKYATARSAGNYLAGMNGATGKFDGDYLSQTTYMKMAGRVHAGMNWDGKHNLGAPYYGEIPYAGRMILAGFQAGVKKRK